MSSRSVTSVADHEEHLRIEARCASPGRCIERRVFISVVDKWLLIVLIQGLKECHQGGGIVWLERDASKLDVSIAHRACTSFV